eukprot:3802115-Amphidinium_carterae.1
MEHPRKGVHKQNSQNHTDLNSAGGEKEVNKTHAGIPHRCKYDKQYSLVWLHPLQHPQQLTVQTAWLRKSSTVNLGPQDWECVRLNVSDLLLPTNPVTFCGLPPSNYCTNCAAHDWHSLSGVLNMFCVTRRRILPAKRACALLHTALELHHRVQVALCYNATTLHDTNFYAVHGFALQAVRRKSSHKHDHPKLPSCLESHAKLSKKCGA